MKCLVMHFNRLFLPLLVVVFVSGCGATQPLPDPQHRLKTPVLSANSESKVKAALYAQYRNWRGVKYREGGLSRKGVDCSGFIHLTFRDRFGLPVPRTTELLAKAGRNVSNKNLRPGDIVFFKTGMFKHHAGIYIENGKFIHASTSKGVTISSLNNVYWSRHYWKSVRLVA